MEFNKSCLYINDNSSYQDGHNIKQILESIESNMKQTNLRFRTDFLQLRLFLINKFDLIPNTNIRDDIKIIYHKVWNKNLEKIILIWIFLFIIIKYKLIY